MGDLNPAATVPLDASAAVPAERPEPAAEPLRSIHTSNFPTILDQLGVSIAVSTYQAAKLVLLRSDAGKINTHFRTFPHPMGIAADGDRLAVGGGMRIWEFHNLPAVAAKLEPAGKHDACYLPRSVHVTGDVQVHELQYGADALWFVNTRFSCLATLDGLHSFVPRWLPPYVTALAPEDRCHLNGLCVVEGKPCFVTALGETNGPAGWRQNKKDGGVVIEVETGRTLARGLSMPHSPRWYEGRLWLLESGTGGFGYLDARTREFVSMAKLPGFTRGIDFCGPLAFIGLSQVRETAVFSGVPITEQKLERRSGVWVVNIHTGATIAWLQFEGAVQEIFAVQVLRGIRYPELVGEFHPLNADSFELPESALEQVPDCLTRRVERSNVAAGPRASSRKANGESLSGVSRRTARAAQSRNGEIGTAKIDVGPDGLGWTSCLARLAADFAWPAQRPSAPPNERGGWLSASARELLSSVLSDDTRVALELGSWLGLSTRFIADRAPNAVVLAVDHWQGSSEHRANPAMDGLLPVLYETFLSSCWNYRTRIIPLRMDSQHAIEELAARGILPDVVYLDAAHEYDAVAADIAAIRRFFPSATLVGDDWDWPSVRLAARHVAEAHGATIRAIGTAWRFYPFDAHATVTPSDD